VNKTIEKLQWIYLDDVPSVFAIDGVRYCAGVANKSGAEHLPIECARDNFDDEAFYDYLDDSLANKERWQAAMKCEILVPDHLPLKYFKERFPKP